MNSQHTMSKATLSSPSHTNDLVTMSFNVGVVGCGRWGTKHLETLAQLKNQGFVDEIYACDLNPNCFDQIPSSVNGVFHNWMDMHQAIKLDLISIVTPNSTHLSLGVAMLQQGLNVLIEKPLGVSFEEVKLLCDAAKISSGTLHSGYLLRHHSGVELAKQLIEERSMGRVKSIRFTKYSSRKKPINANVIENLASHAFAIIPTILGSTKSPLFSVAVTLEDGKPAPLITAPQAKFHMVYSGQGLLSNVDAEVCVGWGQADRNQLTVEGTKHHLRIDFWNHHSIEYGTQKTGYETLQTPSPVPPLEAQYKHILSNTTTTLESIDDHLRTATLLDKATSLAQHWHLHNA